MEWLSKENSRKRILNDIGIRKWLLSITHWFPPVFIFYALSRRTLLPLLFMPLGTFSLGLYKGFFAINLGSGGINELINIVIASIWASIGINVQRNIALRELEIRNIAPKEYSKKKIYEQRHGDKEWRQWCWAIGHYVPMLWAYYSISRRSLWPISLVLCGYIFLKLFTTGINLDPRLENYLIIILIPIFSGIGIGITRRRARLN